MLAGFWDGAGEGSSEVERSVSEAGEDAAVSPSVSSLPVTTSHSQSPIPPVTVSTAV